MRMRLIGLFTVFWIIGSPFVGVAADGPSFRVIAHPSTKVQHVGRDFLADAFLKRTTRWADGARISPVDQRADADVRERFSERVLRRSVSAVRSYWQQMIFGGRDVPPPELETDEAVIRYVSSRAGAVGYVSSTAQLDNVRVLEVR